MTESEIRYASNVWQETGGGMSPFTDLENIKKQDGFARSAIAGSGRGNDKPSRILCNQFGFNIPDDARVTEIIITVGHQIWGNDNGTPAKAKPAPNVGNAYLHLFNWNDGKYVSAPVKDYKYHVVRLPVVMRGSEVNNWQWGLALEYNSNTKADSGFLFLKYIAVSVVYTEPNYSISATKVTGQYNLDEYSVKVDVSNVNMTDGYPKAVITAPSGLTVKRWSFPAVVDDIGKSRGGSGGRVVKTSARTVEWDVPLTMFDGTASLVVVYDTDVIMSGDVFEDELYASLTNYNQASAMHLVHLVEKPPVIDTETAPVIPADFVDDGESFINIEKIVLDDEFNYTFQVTENTMNNVLYSLYTKAVEEEMFEGTYDEFVQTSNLTKFSLVWHGTDTTSSKISKNEKMKRKPSTSTSWATGSLARSLTMFIDYDYSYSFGLKGVELGYDEIYMDIVGLSGMTYSGLSLPLSTWKFLIIPSESDLTVPYMSILAPSDEECDRLGDEYPYICQTNLKQITEEEYSRDWYKNFRLGVFNNRIEANITVYNEVKFQGNLGGDIAFLIPSRFDLTGKKVTFTSTKAVTLEDWGGTEHSSTTSFTINDLSIYNPNVKCHCLCPNGDCTITMSLKDSSNNVLYSMDYIITLSASADSQTEITEDSTDYDNLTDSDIFNGAEYWSSNIAGLNEYNNVECPFVYDEDYPLYIIVTGDYPEGAPSDNDVKYLEPCLIEQSNYGTRQPNGIFLEPILSVLDSNDASDVDLNATESTNEVVLYDFPLSEDYGTDGNIAIRGVGVSFIVEQADEQVLTVQLKSPSGAIGTRTLIIDDTDIDNELFIGGNGDLWGFNTLDMIDLNSWEMEVSSSNILNNLGTHLKIKDAKVHFYVEQVERQNIICKIEGEDIAYYGAFITGLTVPAGLKTSTSYLNIDGTDTNDAYRQNIKEKTIELTVDIGDDCSLEASTSTLQQFTRLLLNEKDNLNRPIPKRLELSIYPDVYWEYIVEDTLDTDIDITNYTVKAKLVVPSGTAYNKEASVTNTIGYVQGVASVNPVITIIPTGIGVSIQELESEQLFNLTSKDEWKGKLIEIDCRNRKVYLKENEDDTEPVKIADAVDYDSDWFVLKNEYNFIGTNCVIRTVTYTERW